MHTLLLVLCVCFWLKDLYAHRGNMHFLCKRNIVITSYFVREFPGHWSNFLWASQASRLNWQPDLRPWPSWATDGHSHGGGLYPTSTQIFLNPLPIPRFGIPEPAEAITYRRSQFLCQRPFHNPKIRIQSFCLILWIPFFPCKWIECELYPWTSALKKSSSYELIFQVTGIYGFLTHCQIAMQLVVYWTRHGIPISVVKLGID